MGRNDRKILFNVRRIDEGLLTTSLSFPIKVDQYVYNKIRFTENGGFTKDKLNNTIPGMVEDLRRFLSAGNMDIMKHNYKAKRIKIGSGLHSDILKLWSSVNTDGAVEGNIINLAFILRIHNLKQLGHSINFENVYNFYDLERIRNDEK